MNEINLTKITRYRNNVKAHKILAIEGNKLIFRPQNGADKTTNIEVSNGKNYSVGEYIDLIVGFNRCNGRITSYRIRFVGKTPDEFVPANGEDIGD